MKTKFLRLSLFLALALVTPICSASEVEQLRAINAQQAKRIVELEQKIAQLTQTPPPIPKVAETCPEPSSASTYTVKEGDNLLRIARNHGTTTAVLNQLNGLKPDEIIRVGQKLKVPNSSPAQVATPVQPTTPAPATQPKITVSVQHKVAEKETLSSIARKYDVSTDAIIKANSDINPNVLKIGQKINIPESPRLPASVIPVPGPEVSPPTATTPQTSPAIDYSKPIKISEKMTFEEFARKHNTTTDRINELNNLNLDPSSNLAKGSEFYVGQP